MKIHRPLSSLKKRPQRTGDKQEKLAYGYKKVCNFLENLMNLLPKTHEEFGEKEYWNAFFKKRGSKAFEWYGEYPELCILLNKYIKQKDVILVVGCGNSILSVDMYTVGYRQITNIDISHVVIKQMQEYYSEECPEMVFQQMDALEMSFSDGQFSVVLDKGTLDALMPDNSEETSKRIDKFFSEIDRVLRIGGRYICISLLQEHILAKLLDFFPAAGWMFRVCRCTEVEQKAKEEGDKAGFPVFFVVCTKFKKLPNAEPVLELAGNHILRVSSPEEVKASVKSLQQSAMVCSRLRHGNIAKQGEVFLELYQPGGTTPRYTVHVLDQLYARENGRRFAAFVVPQGRETEWLFSTPEGRATLIKSAGFDRLAVVTLHREHTYNGLDAVQEELNESILLLAPTEPGSFRNSKDKNYEIPFLSVGSDVGRREVCYQGHSDISGDFVVEELERDGGLLFRRLVFLNNPSVVQSEARLKILKSRKGKPKKMVDTGYLACEHHIFMTVGVALVAPEVAEFNVAVIGLGGGGLCTYLQNFFQKIKITAVDIDPAMLEVATEYFGLVQNDRLEVYIRDGIHFIHQAAEKGTSYHAILFDVDSKNLESGMNCPPPQFLEPSLLQSVRKCIGTKGLFVLNLVCRAASMRELALSNLKSVFKSVCSYKLEQEVNEILFCTNNTMEDDQSWKTQIENASNKVNTIAKKKKFQIGDLIDVLHLVGALKIS